MLSYCLKRRSPGDSPRGTALDDNIFFYNNYKKMLEKKHPITRKSDATTVCKRYSERQLLKIKQSKTNFSPLKPTH